VVSREFRDGHQERWWAAELQLAGYGPDQRVRLVVVSTDPATLPQGSTWYLATNLPRPGSPRARQSPFEPADLGEVVRVYGLRIWIEQSYKQVKQELGWADFMVRTDRAIGRHWLLMLCAFCFCWRAWFECREKRVEAAPRRGEKRAGWSRILAGGAKRGEGLAEPVDPAVALVAGLVAQAPAAGAEGVTGLGGRWSPPQPSPPFLTNYR